MKAFNPNFDTRLARSMEVRLVIEIAWDALNVDAFTSHPDISWTGVVVYSDTLVTPAKIPGSTLREFTVDLGTLSVTLKNTSAVDAAFGSRIATFGESKALVRVYVGFEGLDQADYELFTTLRLRNNHAVKGDSRAITAGDPLFSTRSPIFEPAVTNVDGAVAITDSVITVESTVGFETVQHGSFWTDAPSQTVGYARLKDEIFRYTGTTSTTFTGVTRGVFGTTPETHEPDATEPPEVKEVVFLEGPAPIVARAILSGDLDGASLPDAWHLGLDVSEIDSSSFEDVGPDLFDSADFNDGAFVSFIDPGSSGAKSFIEDQISPVMGCFVGVNSAGQAFLRRRTRAVKQDSPVAVFDLSNTVVAGSFVSRTNQVRTRLAVDWSKRASDGVFRRTFTYEDLGVASRYESSERKLRLEGLSGTVDTQSTLNRLAEQFRDWYTSPPLELKLTVNREGLVIEIGDIVRVVDVVEDVSLGGPIDRSFFVVGVVYDLGNFTAQLTLRGNDAVQLDDGDLTNNVPVMLDSYYSSGGTNLESDPNVSSGVTTGDVTITGSVGSFTVFYVDGDFTISAGTTLFVVGDCELRVKGVLQVNGNINGVGSGPAGATDPLSPQTLLPSFFQAPSGTDGYVGNTRAGHSWISEVDGSIFRTTVASGETPNLPAYRLRNNAGTSIRGTPRFLSGTSGGAGGRVTLIVSTSPLEILHWPGPDGGAAGAGLMIVCRGMNFGVAGSLNLNGDDGLSGILYGPPAPAFFSGAGAGGAAGACLVLLDGSLSSIPDMGVGFSAVDGDTPQNDTPQVPFTQLGIDRSATNYRVLFIPPPRDPLPDQSQKPGSAIFVDLDPPVVRVPVRGGVPRFGEITSRVGLQENGEAVTAAFSILSLVAIDAAINSVNGIITIFSMTATIGTINVKIVYRNRAYFGSVRVEQVEETVTPKVPVPWVPATESGEVLAAQVTEFNKAGYRFDLLYSGGVKKPTDWTIVNLPIAPSVNSSLSLAGSGVPPSFTATPPADSALLCAIHSASAVSLRYGQLETSKIGEITITGEVFSVFYLPEASVDIRDGNLLEPIGGSSFHGIVGVWLADVWQVKDVEAESGDPMTFNGTGEADSLTIFFVVRQSGGSLSATNSTLVVDAFTGKATAWELSTPNDTYTDTFDYTTGSGTPLGLAVTLSGVPGTNGITANIVDGRVVASSFKTTVAQPTLVVRTGKIIEAVRITKTTDLPDI